MLSIWLHIDRVRCRFPLLVALAPAFLSAQGSPLALTAPIGRLDEEFGRIYSVRELADGRVLISDNSNASRLVVADLVAGNVKELGRVGNGPGEYQHPAGRLLALPDDSTLFVSGGRPPRWLVLHGARIVATVPADDRAFLAANNAVGADDDGNVLANRTTGGGGSNGRRPQVVSAIIANRRTGRIDTVTRMTGLRMSIRQAGTAQRPFWIETQLNYSVAEQSMLFPDGWIATVRVDPYRVDWRAPSGHVTLGPDLGWKSPPVDAREKAAFSARVSRRVGSSVNHDNDPWTVTVPPIRSNPLLAMPDGSVLVLRSQWSGMESNRYDIVDRRGRLAGFLSLANEERVVGFGRGAVYIAIADDDGIERLRKHSWP